MAEHGRRLGVTARHQQPAHQAAAAPAGEQQSFYYVARNLSSMPPVSTPNARPWWRRVLSEKSRRVAPATAISARVSPDRPEPPRFSHPFHPSIPMPGAVEFDSLFTTLETSARAIRKVAEENAHALMAPIRLSALVGNTARASRSRTRGSASRLTCCRRFSRAMYPTDRRPARAPPVARISGLDSRLCDGTLN